MFCSKCADVCVPCLLCVSGGLSVSLLFRYLTKPSQEFSAESPRLSSGSVSSNERAPSATPSDSSDRRPLSLISTLSSGSGSSRDDATAPQPPQSQDAALSPEGEEPPDRKGRSLGLELNNNNTDDSESPATWGENRSPSRRQQTPVAMAPSAQLTYLDRVVMEIIETERMYVRDLRMIVEDYLAHIIDQSDVSIRPEQVCSLFGNIEDIYEFNSELLQDLDLCHNDPVAVARCFVLKSEYFEIYTQYCTNYPNSVAALTECMRNKSLAKFFRERQESLKRSLPLGSYLLKPVQRILKYHLLLQEIAKHFDHQQQGYDVVEEAIITMTTVAWYINDMKRKHEHAVRLQEVQSLLLNWKGADLTTFGELVLEGNFKLHRAKNERTLFLFQRMLLITKRRGEHYIYKTHISCSTLMLIESAKDSLSFSVTHYKQPKQPHTVQAKTVEEKKLWAHHIKRIILENHHALIPQKAKEAILEMDSIYPPGYRYSPERLKKAHSSQADELPRNGRQGRRQSEPIKETLKSTQDVFKEEDEEEEGETLSPQRSHGTPAEDSELDDILLEDEQEDDFASSVLAAIACWHFSAAVMEVDEGSSNGCKKENVRLPEEEEAAAEAVCKRPCEVNLPPEKTSESEPTEENPEPEPEPSSNPDSWSAPPPRISASPRQSDRLKLDRDPEPASAATTDSDSKTLSSGESSEDEAYLKGAPEKAVGSPSILPSSVLDKASAIAQHFAGSVKRGSLAQDDVRSPSCASPRLPRSGGGIILNLGAEPLETQLLNSNSPDSDSAFGATDLTMLSPRSDSLFDGLRRRRDSTLSRKDQLLIGKIRSYYENAESEDATFSMQRRESLTYIPTGLVRSSVSRLNSIPNDDTVRTNPANSAPCFSLESNAALPADTPSHMVSSDSLDSFKSDQRSTDPEDSEGIPWSRSQSLQDNPSEDEEFRPSSEMIKVWQTMEREITGSKRSQEAPRVPRATADDATKAATESRESGASDLSTITEESSSPAPPKLKASGAIRTRSRRQDGVKVFGEDAVDLRAPIPRVSQLNQNFEAQAGRRSEDSNQWVEVDKTKSKVLHLARQYSQRLKTCEPAAGQRSTRLLMNRKPLACVLEEKESTGKPSLTLPLVSDNQAPSLPLTPVDQIQSVAPGLAVPAPDRPLSRSPVSPISPLPAIEGFNWPDVRELRSKYSDHGRSQKSSVGRSHSIPEQMFDVGLRRHSSCSSGLLLADAASGEVNSSSSSSSCKPRVSRGAGREARRKRLHRANSLEPRLSGAQTTELHALQDQVATGDSDGYYVAAEASLPDDPEHKIIVMEKLPEPAESKPAETAIEEEDNDDDNYIQIRSPTSREKISIMAVIDRCRLYQESDEYQQREDVKAKTEPDAATAPSNGQNDETQKMGSNAGQKTEAGQQNIVKNLREKFQNLS
ncbi:pleckstrin homology domain-containing family G member 3 isoform X3 [Perca fluviatilis]|uniref:pleckstrin homology domain-containing family G member 3 isoform X3 n=1 Tax=Perca fluviatilis TaxID=8168 RepID=UPI0019623690|nr:pleckstrin homology domain-containing family G member 3 isoform X3 [Perca fluviatilis]